MKNEKIVVAQVVGKLAHAGVEAVVNNYFKHINRDRFHYIIYYFKDSPASPPEEMVDLGAEYVATPTLSKPLSFISFCRKSFIDRHVDIVVSNLNTLSIFPLFAAWQAGIPLRISHSHSTAGKGEIKRTLAKYLLRPFSHLFVTDYLACSRLAGEFQFGRRFCDLGRVTMMRNAIDTGLYSFDSQARDQIREELGISPDCLVLGHCGRFVTQKNHSYLLDIFHACVRPGKDVRLILVGDGPLRGQIESKARSLGVFDRVIFTGNLGFVGKLYSAMDVFIMPSNYEGLSVVAVEAQCAGLPCILSSEMSLETKITDSTKMLPISHNDIGLWVDEVWRVADKMTGARLETVQQVKWAGYDIETEAQKYERFLSERFARRRGTINVE